MDKDSHPVMISHGGITIGKNHFFEQTFIAGNMYRTVLTNKYDAKHTFYWTSLVRGYRALFTDELKRIGWIDAQEF